MITLQASAREATGKAARKEAAASSTMPAVVYGPKQEAMSISIGLADFERVLRNEGESTLIELSGLAKPVQVLIHEVDVDPVTSRPRHADFYAIEKGAKVKVSIPLSYVGESPAVKAGANIVKVLHEVEVEADPSKLPHEIEVDITALAAEGDQVHVSDLKAPAGVTFVTDGDEVVALAQAVEVEPEEPAAALDMDAIEVEKKGKEEGEEGAAG
ncbi:MAG TPA: 50S ribosomal protein L25 [Candidatus Paceibacterota bacterium]|nr:50S ribosomal protein L25 [Candidatus Paceibacterota bacterium]